MAEEVVQDTFLALWDRAESFDPATGSLAAWLHTIARNRTVDRLRAAGRRPPLVSPPAEPGRRRLGDAASSSGPPPAARSSAGAAAPAGPGGGLRLDGDARRSIERALADDAGRGADGHRPRLPRGAVADRRSPSGSAGRSARSRRGRGGRCGACARPSKVTAGRRSVPVATGEDG